MGGLVESEFIDEAQKLSGEVVKELFSLFDRETWIPEVFQSEISKVRA